MLIVLAAFTIIQGHRRHSPSGKEAPAVGANPQPDQRLYVAQRADSA